MSDKEDFEAIKQAVQMREDTGTKKERASITPVSLASWGLSTEEFEKILEERHQEKYGKA